MVVLSYIISFLFLSFMVLVLVKGIIKSLRNEIGYHQMEADRNAKGMPFYGDMEEELEKERAKYEQVKRGMMKELLTERIRL